MFEIDPIAMQQFKSHAANAYPNEAVGYVWENVYRPLDNIADNPEHEFLLSPDQSLEVLATRGAVCVLHSHTNGNNYPSYADIENCALSGAIYGLSVVNKNGDDVHVSDPFFWGSREIENEIPLKRRTWRNGPTGTDWGGDCYALIKDFYLRELGIELLEYPRDPDDFKDGANHFEDYFQDAGFSEVPIETAQRGDLLLIAIRSKVPNHGAVMIDDSVMLHHAQNRLSGEDLAARWRSMIRKVIRHESLFKKGDDDE